MRNSLYPILFWVVIFLLSNNLLYGQIRIVESTSNSTAYSSPAFIDASSNIAINTDANLGKGLLFPRADLTQITTYGSTDYMVGRNTSFPTYFDGMIVYNTASGTAGIGGASVTPGFYYYKNSSTNVNGGTWVRLTDSGDSGGSSATPTGTEFPSSATAGQVFYRTDLLDYYYYNGTDWVGVSNKWIPGHDYKAGNFVEYDGNFYIANSDFTSDATAFTTDASRWNYAGGKDAKYYLSEMQMNGKAVKNIAVAATTSVPTDVADSTLVTVGYMNANGSVSTFDANRTITRTGLDGITGQNLNTATVAEFLNKLFFPVLSPLVTSFRYGDNTTSGQYSYQSENSETKEVTDHVGTVSIPYASWKSMSDLTFNYSVSKRDGNSSISSVELLENGTSRGTVTDGSLSGSFTVSTTGLTDINTTQNIPFTLRVSDDGSNVVDLVLNTSLGKANGVSLSNVRVSSSDGGSALTGSEGSGSSSDPYLIERTGSDLNNYVVWNVTMNDDANITDINFTGSVPSGLGNLSNPANTYTPVTFPNDNYTTVYHIGVSAKGDVAQDLSTAVYTSYYRLQDRMYCGYLSGTEVPTEASLKALQQSSLNTAAYYAANGVTQINNTGGSGFFTWAVPTYVDGSAAQPSFSRTAWYYATGQWFENTAVTTHYVKVTQGAVSTWYWVCIYNASTANVASVQAKLTN